MSQDRQRFNINRALLERSDLVVVDEYTDTMSGRTPKRAGYQRLLDDARSGCFSHVAVENAERFGRNDTEALIAIDELHEHGIVVRFADYPDLDPIDTDDRLPITISFTLARRESLKLGERVRGGLYAKLRNGGYTTRAPDGYLNVERKADTPTSSKMGRYERWIEPDPEQFKVWRLAWDLLLTDKHSLAEICENLHLRGFHYRTGRPFIEIKNDRRKPAVNTLSKIFHNWFYAGWVVSAKASIPPKTVKGHWKPVVTTHEAHIADLDVALTIISKVSILYGNLGPHDQRSVLREMVDKIIVNRFGTVVYMGLLPPFAYLKHISDQVKAEEIQAAVDGNQKSSRFTTASQCSEYASVGSP